jgi:hypothetical protein
MPRPKRTPEKRVEDYLVEKVEAIGGVCLKLEVNGDNGWPDRLCVMPYGVSAFVEVKARGGRLSKQQQVKLQWLDESDHLHAVVWDRAGVQLFVGTLHMWMTRQNLLVLRPEQDFLEALAADAHGRHEPAPIRITRAKYNALGGQTNPKLFRRRRVDRDGWHYYERPDPLWKREEP